MKTIIALIRILHARKQATVDDLCRELHCSPATFYRLRNAALSTLQVEIEFFPAGTRIKGMGEVCHDPGGYRIVNYGIIDYKKL
jgi:hypothetical protein